MKTLVIIPTYDERENLRAVVEGVLACGAHALIIDDSSPDGTGEIADDLAHLHHGRVDVLHRRAKSGLGSAYVEGFRAGVGNGFDLICQMDADGSHRAVDLPKLLRAAEHADVVIGSRRVPGGRIIGWGPHRHLMSACAMLLSRAALGLPQRDVTSGFRCYRAAVAGRLAEMRFAAGGYAFQEEALFRCVRMGATVVEVPVTFVDRRRGESKLGFRDVVEFFRVMCRLRWEQ